jgi:hypothetical protein
MSYNLSSEALSEINASLPAMMPQSVVSLSNTSFKVLSAYVPLSRELDVDDIKTMHSAAFGDQFELISESVEFVGAEGRKNVITSILEANLVSKPYEERTVKAMKLIQANVFMDDESHIWRATGKGDNRRLVQSVKEDFKAIITARLNARRNEMIASLINKGVPSIEVNPGDFALFYNANSAALDCGFALSEDDHYKVFSYDNREFVTVDPQAMIRVVEGSSLIKSATMLDNDEFRMTDGEFSTNLSKKYQDYMQFLYNGTDYFNNLKALLQLRHKNGMSSLPVSTMH